MSLASQVTALAARVAAEFKARGSMANASVADQTGFAADTYLTGSSVPTLGRLQAKSVYRLVFDVTKTAAGTAAPTLTIRFGTAGAIADTARLTFAWAVGTAVADDAMVEVRVTFRQVGATAVLQGVAEMRHRLATTGFTTTASTAYVKVTSGSFDASSGAAVIGASLNGGASAAWTVKLVQAKIENPSPV